MDVRVGVRCKVFANQKKLLLTGPLTLVLDGA